METIPVRPHPFRQTFDSIEDAVAHAMSHPRRREAEADAARLQDTCLTDAHWSPSEFVLRFSNERWLYITIFNGAPTWQLLSESPKLTDNPQLRVGAPPIYLDWQGWIGVRPMHASELVEKRIGAALTNLFINHTGFFVYFRGHLVFQFHAAYRTDTGDDILYVIEDD